MGRRIHIDSDVLDGGADGGRVYADAAKDALRRGPADATTDTASRPPPDARRDTAARLPADAGMDHATHAPPDAGTDAPDASPTTFAAPNDMRDRIGVYAWGYDTTAWPGAPDRLNWATDEVAALGGRTVRVYLGPQDIYDVLPSDAGTLDLTSVASAAAYATLFSSSSFDTYLLTTYSAADETNNWSAGYTGGAAAAERTEIGQLGSYLLATYPTKTFIVLNWEGDNALSPYLGSSAAWTGYAAWVAARAAGVSDARSAAGPGAKLFSGLEFNLLRSASSGDPCDTGANPCVISVIAPTAPVDYFSYSSWDSLLPDTTPPAVATQLEKDLGTALGWVQMGSASATAARFIVGEFGAPREETDLGECAAANRAAAVIGAISGWGASYGIFWQIIDNVPSGQPNNFVTGFGLYKATGAASLSAGLFQDLYSTQSPTLPAEPSCPQINLGGVVNGATSLTTDIDAGTVLSIYGSAFTDAGDIVHVKEATEDWNITAGSMWFYSSEGQINAQLPGVGPGQNALVYVTNGAGVDSNGQIIPIVP